MKECPGASDRVSVWKSKSAWSTVHGAVGARLQWGHSDSTSFLVRVPRAAVSLSSSLSPWSRRTRGTGPRLTTHWGIQFSSVHLLSRVQLFATPWTAARQASLSITNSPWSLLKLMSTESVMPSNHLILCHPLLLPPSISPSIRVFSNESVLRIRWPKYWSFSFSISPSNEYSGLISFRMDWRIGSHFLNPRSWSILCERRWIILFFCSPNILTAPPQPPHHWSPRAPGRIGLDFCVSFFTTRWEQSRLPCGHFLSCLRSRSRVTSAFTRILSPSLESSSKEHWILVLCVYVCVFMC